MILSNPAYYDEWSKQVVTMASRIKEMRLKMFEKLRQKKVPGNWNHILQQIGMFSFTGLNADQSKAMDWSAFSPVKLNMPICWRMWFQLPGTFFCRSFSNIFSLISLMRDA